jgi:acyl-CoA dehydrogenase
MHMKLEHLRWPFFDDGHRTLAAEFSEWSVRELAAYEADEGYDGQAARRIFKALGRGGWLRKTLPVEALPSQTPRLDLRKISLLREICAYSSAIADVALSEPWLGILPISLAASFELKARYLAGFSEGRLLPAFALSEPAAGSDVSAIQTTARLEGSHYVLNGRKTWTSNAGLADLYVVFARMTSGPEENAISAFVVEPGDGGLVFEECLKVMSPHSVGTWRLDNCRVPAARLLGEPGEGKKIALSALELFRPTVGAAALGFSRRAMDEAVARSLARVAFDKPISEHQLVQAKLADMAVTTDASALLVYRAAWTHDTGATSIGREAAVAKLFSTEGGQRVVDEAVQIFGGLGLVEGAVVERLYRHIRAFRIFDGTSEIQRLIIARDLLRAWNSQITKAT